MRTEGRPSGRLRGYCPQVKKQRSSVQSTLNEKVLLTGVLIIVTVVVSNVFLGLPFSAVWSSISSSLSTEQHFFAFPCLIQRQDGSLMVVFAGGTGKTYSDYYLSTSDDGSLWTPPVRIVNRMPYSGGDSQASLAQCLDGSYMMAYFSDLPGVIVVSRSNDGISWKAPVIAYTATTQIYGVSLIQCRDGSFMIAFKIDTGGDDIRVIQSRDGVMWGSPKLALHVDLEPYIDLLGAPSLIQRLDGSYVIACVFTRNKGDRYYATLVESYDTISWHGIADNTLRSSYYFFLSLIQCRDGSYKVSYDAMQNVYVSTMKPDLTPQSDILALGNAVTPSLIQLSNGSYMIAAVSSSHEIIVSISRDGFTWEAPVIIASRLGISSQSSK